jgi:hypothetical protein
MSGLVITILDARDCARLSGGRQCGTALPERVQDGRWRGPALNRMLATLIRLLRTGQRNIDQRNIAINIALHGSSILNAQTNGLSLRRSA